MRVLVQPAAVKALAGLSAKDRKAMLEKIAHFAADPFAPFLAASPLKGSPQTVRIRHRQWRAVCRIDRVGETVVVEACGDRREIYR